MDDPQAVAEILEKLLKLGAEANVLMAYQIGFDLYESATQQFLKRIQDALRTTAPIPIPDPSTVKEAAKEGEKKEGEKEGDKEAR